MNLESAPIEWLIGERDGAKRRVAERQADIDAGTAEGRYGGLAYVRHVSGYIEALEREIEARGRR